VLILGGTAEARQLAAELVDAGVEVVSSLAGRVANPRLPAGEVRIGGFGGTLAEYLADFELVVDATHPFAERISAAAVAVTPIPLLRLERPGWQPQEGDDWRWVDDLDAAAAALGDARRVFLTTGRQGLASFAGDRERWFLIRCVDPPEVELPAKHEVLLDRGPYTVDGELALVDRHRIDVVVTKDSGGDLTSAKLEAARRRGLPVVVVRRPPRPDAETVTTVAEAVDWVRQLG
jgi:precorrin-6A/cobalt-precorrin-6A reductase